MPMARRTGSAPPCSCLSSRSRLAAVDEQRHAGAEGDQRQQHAGPTGEQRQAGVHPVADRAELLAPQGEGEQDTERDEADRPEVARLDAPERRLRRRARRRARAAGFLAAARAGARVAAPPRVLVTTVRPRLLPDLVVFADTRTRCPTNICSLS